MMVQLYFISILLLEHASLCAPPLSTQRIITVHAAALQYVDLVLQLVQHDLKVAVKESERNAKQASNVFCCSILVIVTHTHITAVR